jgi:hypothetical protein
MAILAAVKKHDFEVGPKLDRQIDIIHSDLLGFLTGVSIRNAEDEANTIMCDVFQAIMSELSEP